MTYTKFVVPEENKHRVASKFKGIFVVEDPGQPFYTAMVNEALSRLNTLPTGKKLLEAIAAATPKDSRGWGDKIGKTYSVLIYRVSISYHAASNAAPTAVKLAANTGGEQKKPNRFKPRGGRSFAAPAQQRLGVASDAAQTKGQGVSALVGWCQNQVMYTPKVGKEKGKIQTLPPALTLGHELIHALHALKGTNKSGSMIDIDGKQTSEEEAYTVGLGKYMYDLYTENRLRKELSMPRRESYP